MIVIPPIPLTDKRFEYRNSAQTDITLTWRKFGWIPKGEQDERQNSRLPQKQRTASNQTVCN